MLKKYLNKTFTIKIVDTILKVLITDIHISNKYSPELWLKFIPDEVIPETSDEKTTIYHRSGWKNINFIKSHELKKEITMTQYILLEAIAPDIVMGCVMKHNDPEVGGIKLKYSLSKEYSITKNNSKEVIFLKPYKENWAINKKNCKKNEWGNTHSPFANIWLEIPENYTNFKKDFSEIFYSCKKVTNSKLIKNLNNKSTKFIIEEVDDESMSNLKKKILLTLGLIYYNIKNRIFVNNQKN